MEGHLIVVFPLFQVGLIEEFVGIEICSGSLRSFRFARVNGEMHILYEFSKNLPSGIQANRVRVRSFSACGLGVVCNNEC